MSRRLVATICVVLAGPMLAGCGAASTSSPVDRTITRAATSPPISSPSLAPTKDTSPTATPPSPRVPPVSGAGINGTTVVDGCPMVRYPPCPDKPVAAHLAITQPDGAMVATANSGNDGRFSIALKPGDYVLRSSTPTGGLPRAPAPMTVHVGPDRYTTVTVRFDSGMR
jgi:hypothetical protein